MESLPQQIVNTLGPLTALAFGIIIWLFILGTPVMFFLALRFLWYRHVYVGRSQELEKLIWQLHRIASALEAQPKQEAQSPVMPEEPQPRAIPMSMFGR